MSLPKIRFSEFAGGWEEKRVSELFSITRGNVLAMPLVSEIADEVNKYPVYSSQTKRDGRAGFFSRFLFEDAITWTTDGANAGDTKLRAGKFYCTNVCGVLLSDKGFANQFVAEAINKVSNKYVSYVGNPKLMNGVMGSIKLVLPTLPEQQKIAAFLGAVDAKLAALAARQAALGRFKAGLMQKLFSQQFRFKRDDGGAFPDWEEKRLGAIASIRAGDFVSASNISTQQQSGLFPCYGGNGLRGYVTIFNREGRYSLIGRQGALCGNVHFVDGRFHATEHALVAEAFDLVIPEWLFFLLSQMQLNQYATGLAQPGISAETVKNLRTSIPSLAEQTKIAAALSAMDTKIQAVADQVAKLQTFKKGLLQQMFV